MLWLLAAALLAQTPADVRGADVFTAGVDVDVVNVDVVVSDRQGRPVTGLGLPQPPAGHRPDACR